MKRLLAAILLSAAAFAVPACIGDDDVPKDPAQQHHYWMNKKLEWSQSILGDLAKTDWDKMGQDARKMRTLSKIEGRFRRTNQDDYRAQLAVFDQANNELVQAVDQENIDGATLAYMHLIHSCVNCHKLVRNDKPIAK